MAARTRYASAVLGRAEATATYLVASAASRYSTALEEGSPVYDRLIRAAASRDYYVSTEREAADALAEAAEDAARGAGA